MLYVGLVNFLFLLRLALAKQGGSRKQIYAAVLFSLFLFSAFRYQVGCDWMGYYFQYIRAADTAEFENELLWSMKHLACDADWRLRAKLTSIQLMSERFAC
jgi:hypothetical protein